MRYRLFDRILIGLLLILIAAEALFLFAVATGILSQALLTGWILVLCTGWKSAVILVAVGAVLLLLVIRLMFAGRRKLGEPAANTATLGSSEIGSSYIAIPALEAMALKHCRDREWCRDCKCTVQPEAEGIRIGLKVFAEPDTHVTAETEALKESLKAYMEEFTGANVLGIDVLVEQVGETKTALEAKA